MFNKGLLSMIRHHKIRRRIALNKAESDLLKNRSKEGGKQQ